MDKIERLSNRFPELLILEDLPCILHYAQNLSESPVFTEGQNQKSVLFPNIAKISLYGSIDYKLMHCPRKHLSRIF